MSNISKNFLRVLNTEIPLWKEEGIITQEQADKIRERYRVYETAEKGIPAKLVKALAMIGALLIGAGVILFFAANWEAIPKYIRLIIVLGLIFGVYHRGYYLKYTKGNYPKIGSALIFLGSLLFGAGIWLVAQTFHIQSRYHTGFLIWAIGILPISYLLNMASITVVSSALLTIWMTTKTIEADTISYLYPILMLGLILPVCYKQRSLHCLITIIAGILIWYGIDICKYIIENLPDRYRYLYSYPYNYESILCYILYISFAFLLYAVGVMHSATKRFRDFSVIYHTLGILIYSGCIYLLCFIGEDFERTILSVCKILTTSFNESPFWGVWSINALLSVLFIFIAYSIMRRNPQEYPVLIKGEIVVAILLLLAPVVILLQLDKTFYAIGFNLLLLLTALSSVVLGYYKKQVALVNAGFLIFIVHFVTRYVDMFYDFMPRSLFFIIAGIIVIGIATIMEKKRKQLITAIKK